LLRKQLRLLCTLLLNIIEQYFIIFSLFIAGGTTTTMSSSLKYLSSRSTDSIHQVVGKIRTCMRSVGDHVKPGEMDCEESLMICEESAEDDLDVVSLPGTISGLEKHLSTQHGRLFIRNFIFQFITVRTGFTF